MFYNRFILALWILAIFYLVYRFYNNYKEKGAKQNYEKYEDVIKELANINNGD